MEKRFIHEIIESICLEKGIDFQLLSYNWIMQLSKKDLVRHIVSNDFDLNNCTSKLIASDKYAMYEVLRSHKVPVINHNMLFKPNTRSNIIDEEGTYFKALEILRKYGKVVVKPNNGTQGIGVYLCRNVKELEYAMQNLFLKNDAISICPFYNILAEYRNFFLDGKCYLTYSKERKYIIGDGVSTLEDLISSVECDRTYFGEDELITVPLEGEKVEISFKHNLSNGSKPKILEDCELKSNIQDLAIKAAKTINIRFATVDIIVTDKEELLVLEINSGVCMNKFAEYIENGIDISKSIYSKAINLMFE